MSVQTYCVFKEQPEKWIRPEQVELIVDQKNWWFFLLSPQQYFVQQKIEVFKGFFVSHRHFRIIFRLCTSSVLHGG
jgi:hypothetical protein